VARDFRNVARLVYDDPTGANTEERRSRMRRARS
jgi:hypothetical protein